MESVDDDGTQQTARRDADVHTDPVAESATDPAAEPVVAIDLDGIERDLADVEIALARLAAGTYWTCEETGRALDDEVMEANPTTRRAG